MKILITSDWNDGNINGVVTSFQNLKRGLTELGHEVRILTLSEHRRSYRSSDITHIGSISANKIYPGARLRSTIAPKLVAELIEWKPDIVHTQCEFSTFLSARHIANALDVPLVHTYHTVYEDYTHYVFSRDDFAKRLVRRFTNIVANRTDCFIAPSEKVRDLLMSYGLKVDIEVVPTGIDLSRFSTEPSCGEILQLKARYNLDKYDTVLVSVGRLAEEKNISEILHYIKRMENFNSRFVIVGDGPYRENLETEVRTSGLCDKVTFTGMVAPDEVANYYRLGDIFLSASTSETQGLSYIEALATSTPLLCKRDSCLDDIIIQGENGWCYDDFEDFCEKLDIFMNLSAKERADMKQSAKERAMSFSYQNFAKAMEQIYIKQLG